MDTPAPSTTDLANYRTSFAKFRTQLALDRTTLAWIRTALTLGTFGFGTVGFFRTIRAANPTPEAILLHERAIAFGVTLVVLGIAATSMSAVAHWFALRRLHRDEAPSLGRCPLSVALALLVSILGLVSLVALLW